jgi:CubicO group peptidase (beta-lactamase class C family)
MRRRLALAAAVCLAALALHAQTSDPGADRLVAQAMAAWHTPAMAVAIVQDDRVVFVKGYGVEEVGKTTPVTADTLFEIASTTKAFTTTALAMLVDEKKVSWDDPVSKYLPGFRLTDPCADALITVRDITSHRSGVGRHDELWDSTGWSRAELLARVTAMPPARPPRAAYQYNNLMFVAAGEVVASAAQMPWEDFIRTRIFAPLNMAHSRISFAEWSASDHATGHRYDRAHDAVVVQPFENYDAIAPAGTIKSSARDMAQWLRFQLASGAIDGKRLLSADALEETHTPQMALRRDAESRETAPETNLSSYGLGWTISDYRGELLVAHAGALNGFRTQVALLPNKHFGVVVLTNVGRGLAVQSLRNALLDRALGGPTRDWNALLLAADTKSAEREEAARQATEAKRQLNTQPSRALDAYAGTYASGGHGQVTVTLENGALVLHWARLTIPLAHWHYDTFHAFDQAQFFDELVTFRLDVDGVVKWLTFYGDELVRQ